MNKNILIGIAVVGALLLIGVLLKDTPQEVNDPTQAQTEEQEMASEMSLPERFFSQIPVHPNLEVKNIRESTKDSTDYVTFSVVVEATKAEVNEWYRSALSQNGWNITSDKNVAGYQIIQAEKENLFTSMQAASGDTEGTVVVSQQAQIRP